MKNSKPPKKPEIDQAVHFIVPRVPVFAKFKQDDGTIEYYPIVAIGVFKDGDVKHYHIEADMGFSEVEDFGNLDGFTHTME